MHRTAWIAAALFFTLAPSAWAAPTGLRVATLAGLERTDAAPGAGAADGAYFGAQLGYDWSLGPVIAGIEGDLGGSTARAITDRRRAAQGLFASAALRLAVPVTSGVRGFARGGYAYHTVNYDSGRAFHGNGWTLGGGGELDLGRRLFVRAEYRYSDYGRAVRGQQFLGGIGLRFNVRRSPG